MPKTKEQNRCPNCGDDVPASRIRAGYIYCKKKECFEKCGRKPHVKLYESLHELDGTETIIPEFDADGYYDSDFN